MSKTTLAQHLCLNFCPYYKPSKKEDLACTGYVVVERLIEKGRVIPFRRSDKALDAMTEETLVKDMCINCPFYESDCNFIQQKGKSLPCGGFTLLGHLLEANVITVDDIRAVR